jgi:hypothetical protein
MAMPTDAAVRTMTVTTRPPVLDISVAVARSTVVVSVSVSAVVLRDGRGVVVVTMACSVVPRRARRRRRGQQPRKHDGRGNHSFARTDHVIAPFT